MLDNKIIITNEFGHDAKVSIYYNGQFEVTEIKINDGEDIASDFYQGKILSPEAINVLAKQLSFFKNKIIDGNTLEESLESITTLFELKFHEQNIFAFLAGSGLAIPIRSICEKFLQYGGSPEELQEYINTPYEADGRNPLYKALCDYQVNSFYYNDPVGAAVALIDNGARFPDDQILKLNLERVIDEQIYSNPDAWPAHYLDQLELVMEGEAVVGQIADDSYPNMN